MNSDELYCSCKLQWFSTWLQNKTFSVTSTCNKPEKLHGKEFTKISVTDLVCGEYTKYNIAFSIRNEIC